MFSKGRIQCLEKLGGGGTRKRVVNLQARQRKKLVLKMFINQYVHLFLVYNSDIIYAFLHDTISLR